MKNKRYKLLSVVILFWTAGVAVLAPPARAEYDLGNLAQRVPHRANADEINESELTLIPGTGVLLLQDC